MKECSLLSNQLKNIFLNNFYKKLGAKFVPFAGFSMPINFKYGIIKEHLHTRNKCGMFDISHMGQMLILYNDKNLNKLENIIPHDLKSLKYNQSIYSFILNSNGCIIDDLIISKVKIESIYHLLFIYNASRKSIDEKIISSIIENIEILNNNSLIALQGPMSYEIISTIFPETSNLSFMEINTYKYNNKNILISRSGYTGEDGFELSIPNSEVENIVNILHKHNNVICCGLGSRDSLRLEAGLCLYGNELTEEISPIEANLKWAIPKSRLYKGNFLGSKRILNDIQNGTIQKRIGVKSLTKSIIRSKMTLHNNKGQKIGRITSGGFSPSLNISIGMGYLENKYLKNKSDIFCLIRDKLEIVKITNLPFIKPNYKRR